MTDDAAQRDTFLSLEEVLGNAGKRCQAASEQLKALAGGGDDPVSLACQEMLGNEEKLIDTLEGFVRNAPEDLLKMRIQYVPAQEEPGRPESAEDAAAQLATVNHQVTETLADLHEKLNLPEKSEALEELHREIETLSHSVSMVNVTMRDQ